MEFNVNIERLEAYELAEDKVAKPQVRVTNWFTAPFEYKRVLHSQVCEPCAGISVERVEWKWDGRENTAESRLELDYCFIREIAIQDSGSSSRQR